MSDKLDQIGQELGQINDFVRDRFDPVNEQVALQQEEIDKLKDGITAVQESQREAKREALRKAAPGGEIRVQSGP